MGSSSLQAANKPGFFKEHVLPLFLIFLIPGFSFWFFGQAERRFDEEIRNGVTQQINADTTHTPEEKARAREFFEKVEVSRIMASNDPQAAEIQSDFESSRVSYAFFRWSKRIAVLCLGSAVFTFIFVGLCALYSLRSQAAQYRALKLGWPVLRGVAVLQVIGQGILAVVLSFWVTALWFDSYFLKLIVIAALLAGTGVVMIVKAIFSKHESRLDQTGELVKEEDAPDLWNRVREIAGRLGTAPPDQIIAGIDASFFVTEHPVTLGGSVESGRTLFLSLPLLKVLTVEEADAVLAHEMAHFSGDDTLWSRRISPFLQTMGRYLRALHANALTRPVFHFIHFFWKLYQYSLGKMSRSREFRADAIGAKESSSGALARALVKTNAYCQYRGKTEDDILGKREVESNLELADRLERGFPAFLTGFTADRASALTATPHPFDTHPTLASRMEALDLKPHEVLADPSVHEPVVASWRNSVIHAPAIEERLWTRQEKEIQELHEIKLAWTLIPRNEGELALVTKHFPEVSFTGPKSQTARMSFESLSLPTCSEPIPFSSIENLELKDSLGKKVLTIKYKSSSNGKSTKTTLVPMTFKNDKGNLLDALGSYYGRYKTALAHQSENAG